MALERRDGRTYYYRSVRQGDKVRRVYHGAGEEAELLARLDELERLEREEEARRERAKIESLEALSEPVEKLSEAAEVLARAHLVAAGYRRVKGEWRLRRERSERPGTA